MAYSTGSATSQTDLIQQLAAWLVTQGWTVDASQASGTGWRCHLHKGGIYAHFRTIQTGDPFNGHYLLACNVPTLAMYLSSGFEAGSGGSWYNNLSGAPLGASDGRVCGAAIVVNVAANFAYHFFNDGNDNYVVIVERSAGIFHALGFGFSLTKNGGNWTGGQYFWGQISGGETAEYPVEDDTNMYAPFAYGLPEQNSYVNAAFVRIDVDAFTDKWVSIGPNTSYDRVGWTGKQGHSSHKGLRDLPGTIPHTTALDAFTVSSVNTQAVLLPIRIYAEKDEGGPCLIGTAPSVFRTKAVGNGYLAGDEVTLGADIYKLFQNFAVKKVA